MEKQKKEKFLIKLNRKWNNNYFLFVEPGEKYAWNGPYRN